MSGPAEPTLIPPSRPHVCLDGHGFGGVHCNEPCGCRIEGCGLLPHPWQIVKCAKCAAAPDMLAALQAICNPTQWISRGVALANAREAIRKATKL